MNYLNIWLVLAQSRRHHESQSTHWFRIGPRRRELEHGDLGRDLMCPPGSLHQRCGPPKHFEQPDHIGELLFQDQTHRRMAIQPS